MPGAAQHAAGFGTQRKDVPGAGVVAGLGGRIGQVTDGRRAVVGADARRAAIADQVDRHGKGGFVQGGVAAHHEAEAELVGAFFLQGRADEAPPVGGHEIDGFGRHRFGGADEIPFVFAVFVIHDNNDFTGAKIGEGFFNGVELNITGHGVGADSNNPLSRVRLDKEIMRRKKALFPPAAKIIWITV